MTAQATILQDRIFMDLNRQQWFGVGVTIVGFVIVALASLWLASLASAGETDTGGLLVRAGGVFVFVLPMFIFGIYQYTQGSDDEDAVHEEMVPARQMMDIINERGEISLHDLSIAMQTDAETVKAAIISLLELKVFAGYADWQNDMIYSAEAYTRRTQHTLPNHPDN